MPRELLLPDESVTLFVSRGVGGLQPKIKAILPKVEGIIRDCVNNDTYRVVITGAQEWKGHDPFSRHHTGFAVDIRTKDFPGGGVGAAAKEAAARVRKALGQDYYVLLHKPPDPPHLHIEYRYGVRISEPGDFPELTIG